ncbi:MAG TPA: hypothetical protein VH596_10910 [Terriglobales bacterium]|jgi:hypothetical protein
MQLHSIAFYGGPDQVMTVTSGLASIVGFLLIFWNKIVATFFKIFGRQEKSSEPVPQQDTTKTSS